MGIVSSTGTGPGTAEMRRRPWRESSHWVLTGLKFRPLVMFQAWYSKRSERGSLPAMLEKLALLSRRGKEVCLHMTASQVLCETEVKAKFFGSWRRACVGLREAGKDPGI
jgi:hypothetical protein